MKSLPLIALLGFAAPVLAQDAVSAAQPSPDVEEVVVPGVRPQNLYAEIERLEGTVYERFNALNSNDDFDIHCFKQAPTGSNIPARRCAPNFVVAAESAAARNSVVGARGRADSRNTGDYTMQIEQKSRELTEEMQRIARGDEQLLKDLVRLDELRQLQAKERGSDR
jgi:hypothetical protein